jgi:hypothetical protein
MDAILKNNPENFEAQYEKGIRLQAELEKIEIIAVKLKEKYSGHKEALPFIDYLADTEKVFTTARMMRWSGERLRGELVKSGARNMSLGSQADLDIFNSIGNDFQQAYINVKKIHIIAQEILDKYKDCEECADFIRYVEDILIVLSDLPELNINEAKEKIFCARMKVMSASGDPKLSLLEEIYSQFKKKLAV